MQKMGLQSGRKDIRRESPGRITDGVTLLRSRPEQPDKEVYGLSRRPTISGQNDRVCLQQFGHCDRAKEGSLRDHPLQDVPISGLLAVQDGTRMVVQGSEIEVPTGYYLLFRGDLCHAGAGYKECHTRLHFYLDPIGWAPDLNLHGCHAD